MRLECRHDLLGEAADLFDKHLVRRSTTIQGNLHYIGAGVFGIRNDSFGDFLGSSQGQVLGPARDILFGHIAHDFTRQCKFQNLSNPLKIGH